MDTPILTGAIGEEAGNLFATDYFDLGKAYLAQTGQLYVEAAAAALGKVYCFGPTFRAEKSKTRRHLTEFWMVEPEVAFNDSDANMRLQEAFVSYIVARALERRARGAEGAGARHRAARAGRARPSRGSPTPTRSRGSTSSAPTSRGAHDLGGDDETLLAKEYDRPVFVYNYPKEREGVLHEGEPRRSRAPCSTTTAWRRRATARSSAAHSARTTTTSCWRGSSEQGLDPEAYRWYLDLRKYGTFVHSGFGLGVERTVAWICGIPHIREAIAFPRQIHRLYPS